MELLTKLGINWQLLIAQIINFLIVLGVLSMLVYKPLLAAIDKRTERIRRSMEDAAKIEKQKEEMEALRAEQLKAIDREAGEILQKTKQEAEKVKSEILAAAKREADDMLAKGKRQLMEERERVFRDVQDELVSVIVRATESILRRELSDADQKRLTQSLVAELSPRAS